jgi:Beta-propeller repeat
VVGKLVEFDGNGVTGTGIAVDGFGNAYITGFTFPPR